VSLAGQKAKKPPTKKAPTKKKATAKESGKKSVRLDNHFTVIKRNRKVSFKFNHREWPSVNVSPLPSLAPRPKLLWQHTVEGTTAVRLLNKVWDFAAEREDIMESLLTLSTVPKVLKKHALNYDGFMDGVVSAYPLCCHHFVFCR